MEVLILGETFKIKEYDILEDKFYIDIVGVINTFCNGVTLEINYLELDI